MKISFNRVSTGPEELAAVKEVLDSGWLAAGPKTEQFEKEFARYVGVKYAIFTNSCTSALKMAYKWVLETRTNEYGFELIYPSNTFCATYAAGKEVGLDMFAYDKAKEWDALYKKFGWPKIDRACKRVNVHYGSVKDETPCLIEDSAHRIEPNDPLIGRIRCYSFYATKNMTTGSGGMFTTNDRDIYERARLYWKDGLDKGTRERFSSPVYSVVTMAGGYDGNDIAAAIGIEQLKKLPEFTKRRNEIVARYNQAFGQSWEGNHLYPLLLGVEKVFKFIEEMDKAGIKCGYHYPNTNWPSVSLPLYPLLTDEEVEYIIRSSLDIRDRLQKL